MHTVSLGPRPHELPVGISTRAATVVGVAALASEFEVAVTSTDPKSSVPVTYVEASAPALATLLKQLEPRVVAVVIDCPKAVRFLTELAAAGLPVAMPIKQQLAVGHDTRAGAAACLARTLPPRDADQSAARRLIQTTHISLVEAAAVFSVARWPACCDETEGGDQN
jgi:hypothetical protein